MGQASPQPMVITTSEALTASGVRMFGVAAVMSMPSSAMASTATGLSWSAGSDPAERTSMRPWPSSRTRSEERRVGKGSGDGGCEYEKQITKVQLERRKEINEKQDATKEEQVGS